MSKFVLAHRLINRKIVTKEELTDRLNQGILVLDGAMGTMIMQALASQQRTESDTCSQMSKGYFDELVLSRPELIRDIHTSYLESVADIIKTNTFNTNRFSIQDDKVCNINRKAAELARKAVNDYCLKNDIPMGKRPIVAGSMGPTTVSLSKCQDGQQFEDLTIA